MYGIEVYNIYGYAITVLLKNYFCSMLSYKNWTSIEDIVGNYISPHVTKLQELNTHISIRHLNTQLMTSTLDEFQFIVNETKLDIITLLGISLKNDNLTCLVKNPPIETEMRKDVAV